MYKAIAITNEGLEKFSAEEVSSLLKVDTSFEDTVIHFSVPSFEPLCSLCYNARTISKVMLLLETFEINSVEDINSLDLSCFKDFLSKDCSFLVRCSREGNHNFSSQQISKDFGALLFEKFSCSVDVKNPDVIVYLYILNKKCYLGIDFSGFDLSKRDYRIFSFGDSLKGTVAQAMNLSAKIKPSDVILDPFCSSGVFSIEQALFFSKKSVHFYNKDDFAFLRIPFLDFDSDDFFEKEDKKILDKKFSIYCSGHSQKNVKVAEKNAKIAGINKLITFTRNDIDWIDTKFSEKEIDKIITFPPQMSKRANESFLKKLFNNFFYASEFILKDKGSIVLCFNDIEILSEALEEHNLMIAESFEVMQGQECFEIFVIKKK